MRVPRSILLKGGCGHGSFRFLPAVPFDDRFRPADAPWSMLRPASTAASLAYPPYNIEKTGEDAYRLTMAVAGFSPDELDVTVQENSLLVTGKAKGRGRGEPLSAPRHRPARVRAPLQPRRPYQGGWRQPRQRHAACRLVHEVPEAAKPRKIAIGGTGPQVLEQEGRLIARAEQAWPENETPPVSGGVFVRGDELRSSRAILNQTIGSTALSAITVEPVGIAPAPIELGHALEIHPVHAGDERRRDADHRDDRQHLDDVVLLDVDQAERRVEQELDFVDDVRVVVAERRTSWRTVSSRGLTSGGNQSARPVHIRHDPPDRRAGCRGSSRRDRRYAPIRRRMILRSAVSRAGAWRPVGWVAGL